MSRSAGRDCDSPANQPSAAARARRHSLSSWTNTSSGRHATRAAAPLLLHRATDDRVRHRVGPGLSTLATAGTAGIARAGARRRSSSDYAELPGVQPAIPFSSLLADALRHAGKNEIQQPSALRAMARRGLEPGTPRFSVVRSRYLNPIYFQGISSLLATSAASAFSRTLRPFAGRYGRRLGPSAFRWPATCSSARSSRWRSRWCQRAASRVRLRARPPLELLELREVGGELLPPGKARACAWTGHGRLPRSSAGISPAAGQ
jgi:hypothetical protein